MIEQCGYCGKEHETRKDLNFAGIPFKECPQVPVDKQVLVSDISQTHINNIMRELLIDVSKNSPAKLVLESTPRNFRNEFYPLLAPEKSNLQQAVESGAISMKKSYYIPELKERQEREQKLLENASAEWERFEKWQAVKKKRERWFYRLWMWIRRERFDESFTFNDDFFEYTKILQERTYALLSIQRCMKRYERLTYDKIFNGGNFE